MKFTNTILIDDDPIIRYSVKKMITEYLEYEHFCSFSSGVDAIDYLSELKPSKETYTLILLDVNMPIMNGAEFITIFEQKFGKQKQHYSIHLLSHSGDQEEIKGLMSHKMVDNFISKPIIMEELKELLNKNPINNTKSKPSTTK